MISGSGHIRRCEQSSGVQHRGDVAVHACDVQCAHVLDGIRVITDERAYLQTQRIGYSQQL